MAEGMLSVPTVNCNRVAKKWKNSAFKQLTFLLKFFFVFFFMLPACQCGLVEKPQPSLLQLGETATFYCTTSCLDVPVDWWRRTVLGMSQDVYVGGQIFAKRGSRFKVNANATTGKYPLSIGNVTVEDAGTYHCIDYSGAGEESGAELVVLLSSPVLTIASWPSAPNQQLLQTELSATFEYRGKAVLVGRWIMTHRNGTQTNRSSSNDMRTDIGNNMKVVSSVIFSHEDQAKTVKFQICGRNLGCIPELYISYEHYDKETPASTNSSHLALTDITESKGGAFSQTQNLWISLFTTFGVLLVVIGVVVAVFCARKFRKKAPYPSEECEKTQQCGESDAIQSLLPTENNQRNN